MAVGLIALVDHSRGRGCVKIGSYGEMLNSRTGFKYSMKAI